MEKRERRRELLARVRDIPRGERARRSSAIRAALRRDRAFLTARTVFAYLALPGEPDLAPLVGAVAGQRWAFARVVSADRLDFHLLEDPAEARPGELGISEPDPARHPRIEAAEADLVLVPGVGFDPAGRNRLGRGKGYYDRFLQAALDASATTELVGVAFSEQLGPVPAEAHDIPMHRILTDLGWA